MQKEQTEPPSQAVALWEPPGETDPEELERRRQEVCRDVVYAIIVSFCFCWSSCEYECYSECMERGSALIFSLSLSVS